MTDREFGKSEGSGIPASCVLLLDDDGTFEQLLREALSPFGLSISSAPGEPVDWVSNPLSGNIELVVIAVDLPGKSGFEILTQLKSAQREVPVALVTGTVSATEMSLHAKLRLHADLYLDKRNLTPERVIRAFHTVLPEIVRAPEEPELHSGLLPPGVEVDEATRWLFADVTEDEVDVLASLGTGTFATREARLEAEVQCLRQDLEVAESAAKSSPYSQLVVDLRDQTRHQQAELVHLRLEVSRNIHDHEARTRTLAERDEDFRSMNVEREREQDRAEAAIQQLAAAQDTITQIRQDFQERSQAEMHRSEAVVREFEQEVNRQVDELRQRELRIAELDVALEETQRALETASDSDLAELEALTSAHEEILARREQAGAETARIAATRVAEAKAGALAEELKLANEEELSAVLAEHELGLEVLRAEHARGLEESEADHQEALRSIRDESRTAAQEARRAADASLELAHSTDLATLRSAHADDLDQQATTEAGLRIELERTHEEHLTAMRDEHGGELETIRSSCADQLKEHERVAKEALKKAVEVARSEERAEALETIEKVRRNAKGLFDEAAATASDEFESQERAFQRSREDEIAVLNQEHAREIQNMRESIAGTSQHAENLKDEFTRRLAAIESERDAAIAEKECVIAEHETEVNFASVLDQHITQHSREAGDGNAPDIAVDPVEQGNDAVQTLRSIRALLDDLQFILDASGDDAAPAPDSAILLRAIVELLSEEPSSQEAG